MGRQAGATFIHNGFAHFRNVLEMTPFLSAEAFAQVEFNEFLLLRQRRLVGSGVRFGLRSDSAAAQRGWRAYLGAGLMHESEELDTEPYSETAFVRGTSYVNARLDLDDRVAAHAVAYYQPRLADANDYRLIAQAGLSIRLHRHLALETALKGRFDNQPPGGLERYDVEAVNGITVTF